MIIDRNCAQLTAELAAVDDRLARRPALADLSDRLSKIERACAEAGRADQLAAENERLRKRYEQIVISQIAGSTGPTGGWLDSPKAVTAAIAQAFREAESALKESSEMVAKGKNLSA
jgi:hypothetical protein